MQWVGLSVKIETQRYVDQVKHWPAEGRHILAHFDDESIIVYQAYRPEIARYAVEHRALGGSHFSYNRMSWIKPNFLWMMYRCGWGTKSDQQATLALRISRTFFEKLLAQAVRSSFDPTQHASKEDWEASIARSEVRLQWDPDHHPNGAKQTRRALQLGLRGAVLERFGKRELLEVTGMSEFVTAQRQRMSNDIAELQMPRERVYWPANDIAARNIGLTESSG
jgi:hypothetical protein